MSRGRSTTRLAETVTVTVAVQVNGKLRAAFEVPRGFSDEVLQRLVLEQSYGSAPGDHHGDGGLRP